MTVKSAQKQYVYGQKRMDLVSNLIIPNLPQNYSEMTWAEPFAGSFSVAKNLPERPKKLLYNDIHVYDILIDADEKSHLDFVEFTLLNMYRKDVVFYFDPPYYGKEHHYLMTRKDEQFHMKLRNLTDDIDGFWMLSYERCPFIEELYFNQNYRICQYNGNNPYLKKEILIMPF